MIRVAIIGFGNVGSYAYDAVQAAPDMEMAGIVEVENRIPEIQQRVPNVIVVTSIDQLEKVDVAILAIPSRMVPEVAPTILKKGIRTVDSYDIHGGSLLELRENLNKVAKEHGSCAVLSAGWDPGTDSMIRTILEVMAPRGITYTNFGPGMSMGHSVAAKKVLGVKDALSMTFPEGNGVHSRKVYVELEDGVDFAAVKAAILEDEYFKHDDTRVYQVANVKEFIDMGHGVELYRKGVAGDCHNQIFRYQISINNPAVTSQVMVTSARAAMRLQSGAYTMLEIPLIDFLPGTREEIIGRIV